MSTIIAYVGVQLLVDHNFSVSVDVTKQICTFVELLHNGLVRGALVLELRPCCVLS